MNPDAIRARCNRARRRAGLVSLRVLAPRRRLIAMQCADPDVGDLATTAEIETNCRRSSRTSWSDGSARRKNRPRDDRHGV